MWDARTKIHCTVGPACRDADTLAAMIGAGADVFRVNGAYGDASDIAGWADLVRRAGATAGRHAGLLVDLPGPKFRVGAIGGEGRIELAAGAPIVLDGAAEPGDHRRIPLRQMPYFEEVRPGTVMVLGDGEGRLEVVAAESDHLRVRAMEAVTVRVGVGVHFPGVRLPTAVPTRQDRRLLEAAVAAGADMISQSFVRTADDVARLQEALSQQGASSTLVIAKVERVDAVEGVDRIMERADGVLLGRGDLGIDAGVERVPSMQRRVLESGRKAGVPVVIATEMLDSMVDGLRPTRAEASDVAGAVFEGADGVMLSAESAVGKHPVLVVETMASILSAAESDPAAPFAFTPCFDVLPADAGRPDQHVVRAAVSLAESTQAAAIVVFSRQGASAVRLSKERPRARIHAFAASDDVCRRLSLAWGVRPERLPDARTTDDVLTFVRSRLPRMGLASGDRAVLVMGSAEDPAGTTTLIKLFTV